MAVTAKVVVQSKSAEEGPCNVVLYPDYADGRNKEWAQATPALSLNMSLNEEAAKHFKLGQRFTLVFEPEA